MHFKKSIISTGLSLALLMPSAAFASQDIQSQGSNTAQDQQKTELSSETKAKVKALKTKLHNGEITKEQFHQELKEILPEGYKCKHKHKHPKLSEEDKAKVKELKAKLQNKEITKDEFKAEFKKIIPQKADE
jgi:uncharacterized membrane protein